MVVLFFSFSFFLSECFIELKFLTIIDFIERNINYHDNASLKNDNIKAIVLYPMRAFRAGFLTDDWLNKTLLCN